MGSQHTWQLVGRTRDGRDKWKCTVCGMLAVPPLGTTEQTAERLAALPACGNRLNPPSVFTQAWSVTKAIGHFVASGFKTLDAKQYRARLETCDACDQRENHRCRRCGCFVAAKAALPAEQCPLGLWPAHSAARMEDRPCKS